MFLESPASTHHHIHRQPRMQAIPTVGYNVEAVRFQNTTFTVFDIAGKDRIMRRRSWEITGMVGIEAPTLCKTLCFEWLIHVDSSFLSKLRN